MTECNGAVVRVTLLDQNMAVETAHLMDAEDCNAAEGAGSNRQDLALCNVGAQVTLAVALQTVATVQELGLYMAGAKKKEAK